MLKKLKKQAEELLQCGNSKEQAEGKGMMRIINELEVNYVPKWRSITWSINDFKNRAKQKEKSNWKNVYDKTKFKKALKKMIQKHDASEGINWTVIDFWLDNCKKQ